MVQIQAEFYALIQLVLRLICYIQVAIAFNSKDLLIVIDLTLQNPVSEGLRYNELDIFWWDV